MSNFESFNGLGNKMGSRLVHGDYTLIRISIDGVALLHKDILLINGTLNTVRKILEDEKVDLAHGWCNPDTHH